MTTFERIKLLVEEKGIVPSKMMKDLGFSSGLYSQWKLGQQNPSVNKIIKIAEYLNVSVDYLIGRTDDPDLHKK